MGKLAQLGDVDLAGVDEICESFGEDQFIVLLGVLSCSSWRSGDGTKSDWRRDPCLDLRAVFIALEGVLADSDIATN